MDRYLRHPVGRRSLIRGAAVGAGALGLGVSGVGRFGSTAGAQESTPAASGFDAEACYQPFAGAETVQYEKLADPPYNIALSNSYIGNVWRTQMIKMAKAYSETADIAPLISEFQVNTADRDDAAQIAAIENMISNGAQALVILAAIVVARAVSHCEPSVHPANSASTRCSPETTRAIRVKSTLSGVSAAV